jgi:hypothetical protein
VTDRPLAIDLISRERPWRITVNNLDLVAGRDGFGIVVVGQCFRVFDVRRVLRSVPTRSDWRVSRLTFAYGNDTEDDCQLQPDRFTVAADMLLQYDSISSNTDNL